MQTEWLFNQQLSAFHVPKFQMKSILSTLLDLAFVFEFHKYINYEKLNYLIED